MPRAYSSVIQHTFRTKSQFDSLSVCPYLIYVSTSVTPYVLQTLLNQFSNFVGSLSCNHGTDEQTLNTPERVQSIQQECPLTLGIKPL